MNWPVEHRPWPLPEAPWIMYQQWEDLLFMHWPVPEVVLRPLVPVQLPLDTYNGTCWLGITPFMLTGAHVRMTPAIPGLSDFPELNVRTYVTMENKPGVYFFSLDADNTLAVEAARALFHLPYYTAEMSVTHDGTVFVYSSRRTDEQGAPAELLCSYQAQGKVFHAERGSLEYFLTERYCLYTIHEASVYRGEIHHAPWPLQNADVRIERNNMAQAAGIELPDTKPIVHFAQFQPTRIWPLESVSKGKGF
jgi:uncharacterized protein YqjF (DUF2071 family)